MRDEHRLYAISLLTDIAFMMFPFVVTRAFAEAEVSLLESGILGAVSMVCYGAFTSFSGRLSDRLGRRRVIVCGSLLAGSAMAAALVLPVRAASFVLIGALGAGIGLIYPAVIGALSAGRSEQAMSGILLRFCIAWNIGLMLGQGGGGAILRYGGDFGPRIAFMVCTVVMFGVAALATGLAGRLTVAAGAATADDVPPASRERALWFAWMGWTGLFSATFSVGLLVYILPTLMVELGIPPDRHGLILSANRLFCLAVYLVLNFSVIWRYRLTTTIVVHLANFAAMLWLATVRSPLGVLGAVLLNAFMVGTIYYVSIFYATVAYPDEHKGRAGGIHETTIAAGLTTGCLLGGLLGDRFGVRSAFVAAAGLIALTALGQIFLYLAYRRQQRVAVAADPSGLRVDTEISAPSGGSAGRSVARQDDGASP